MRNFIVLITLLSSNVTFSQKQGDNWYFGNHAAVTFNSGKAVALSNSNMTSNYGCATISSKGGKLLFYSNGMTIWDSSHKIMPNGAFLIANSSSVQSALIVPWPDSSHLYYIFTPPPPSPTGKNKGRDTMNYSIIDMNLRSGLGDVMYGKKNLTLPTRSSGKVTSVRHANRKDYWVVIPKGNSDTIHSYLVNAAGVSNSPVISRTGFKLKQPPGNTDSTLGYFKLSPDGRKLCNINWKDSSYVGNFDALTGKVSNVMIFKLVGDFGLGIEFSAKSKYLFLSDYAGTRLNQFDLSAKSKTNFLASRTTVDSVTFITPHTGFQLASDGKIYFSEGLSPYLDILHAPDSAGKKARFQKKYLLLGASEHCIYGLPDMIQSYFHKPSFYVAQNCTRDTVFFNIADTYGLDSAKWDFGDTSSGVKNYSKKTSNVSHSYKQGESYSVKLIAYYKESIDTVYESLTVNYSKPYLGGDRILCNTFKLTLVPKGSYKSYFWSSGSTGKTLTVTKSGIYMLSVIDDDGCKSSDSVVVKNPGIVSRIGLIDSTKCFKGNSFNLSDISHYKEDKRKKSVWYFSDSTSMVDSVVQKSFSRPGIYSVKLVSSVQLGCIDSISQIIRVYQNTDIGFVINKSSQCLLDNNFDFLNTSVNKDSLKYEWDLVDNFSSLKNYIGKKYYKEGIYPISLITTSNYGCKDTLTKVIYILPSPKAEFTWNGYCNRSAIQFIFAGNIPPSPVNTSYHWFFPAGDSSTQENPVNLISRSGLNKVLLILKSDNGCVNSIVKDVEVLLQAKADFEVNNVCEDSEVEFLNTSIDGIKYSWKFGDGNTSSLKSLKHLYHINGKSTTFNVTLVAIVPSGCSDSITKAVTVTGNPNSDFSFKTSGSKVNFTAVETNATKYEWVFGDGGTSNISIPNVSYQYSKLPSAIYTSCLKVTNVSNCFTETCKEINITGIVKNITNSITVNIYPNPSDGYFTIRINEPNDYMKIEIVNQIGQTVHSAELYQNSISLDLNLNKGIYLLKISKEGIVFYQKMIIGK